MPYKREACEEILRAVSGPQVTARRKRDHYPRTSKKVKDLGAPMSSEEDHPKVQKDPAWLAVNDSPAWLAVNDGPLDPEHSKVRPTFLTLELGGQMNSTQSCKSLGIHYIPTDALHPEMTFALVGLL